MDFEVINGELIPMQSNAENEGDNVVKNNVQSNVESSYILNRSLSEHEQDTSLNEQRDLKNKKQQSFCKCTAVMKVICLKFLLICCILISNLKKP